MLKKLIKINLSNLGCILIFYNFAWFFGYMHSLQGIHFVRIGQQYALAIESKCGNYTRNFAFFLKFPVILILIY